MKYFFTAIFLLFISISFAQKDQNNWKSEIVFDDGTSITTFLKVDKTEKQFVITSPKNADIRLFGSFKAYLGRLLGKSPKKGIFLTINANKTGDSLIGKANVAMFGKLDFRGVINENSFNGKLFKNDTLTIGNLTSTKSKKNSINYNKLYTKILKITEDNIYSKEIIQTKEWNKFQKKFKKLCHSAKDDIELYFGFNMLNSNLPFSHYYLLIKDIKKDNKELKGKNPTVIFEEKDKNTAYLKIKNFTSSKNELEIVLPKIIKNNYQNLIIDLRDNTGGGVEPAFEFANHIIDKSIIVGYFTTNRLNYSGFEPKLFETLPEAKPVTTEEFIETLNNGKGAKLVFSKANNPLFLGSLYILTNKRTASTCEPIVYLLKSTNRATIIGENTAGAMLSGTLFDISGKYKLFLPIADFYTYDGTRLEGIGVKPNIETTSENALDQTLRIIKEK